MEGLGEVWCSALYMLKIVRSFHEGMHAVVRVGGTLPEYFEVRNGLRQGCTLAPTLFNLYFSAVGLPGGVIMMKLVLMYCVVLGGSWSVIDLDLTL